MSIERFKWKTGIPNKFVHVMGYSGSGEYTLCGDASDVDSTDEGVKLFSGGLIETDEPISCPVCIGIIKYCKAIRLPKK